MERRGRRNDESRLLISGLALGVPPAMGQLSLLNRPLTSSRRWVKPSTPASVACSTASRVRQGPPWISSAPRRGR
jgi:hypothetical protein